MKIFPKFSSCLAILLSGAVVSRLPAQIPGDPTAAPPVPGLDRGIVPSTDAPIRPRPVERGLIAPQPHDLSLPGVDAASPPTEQSGFLQVPQPPQVTGSGSQPDSQTLIRRQLRQGEVGPWTAAQATGPPNTLTMGDYSTAWAAAMADAKEEWLQVQFTLEADLDKVRVVQSYNPGAITKVTAARSDGQAVVLEHVNTSPGEEISATPEAVAKHARHRKQAGHPDTPGTPAVIAEFVPPAGTSLRTTSVRITIDERKVPGWNEIDAVELVSRNGARQWAQAATASSSFGDRMKAAPYDAATSAESPVLDAQIQRLEKRVHSAFPQGQTSAAAENKGLPWSPEQATGAPDTPVAGDYPTAWAPLTYGGKEWLDVTFARPADVREVRVVESSQTHAITAVQVYVNGTRVPLVVRKEEVGQGTNPGDGSGPVPALDTAAIPQPAPRTVSALPENASLPAVQKVRIELDSTGLTTWPEIDAVELVGTDGSRQWAERAEASSTYAAGYSAPRPAVVGYERARTLEEANQRIDLLTRRLERLEQELKRTHAPDARSQPPSSHAPPPPSHFPMRLRLPLPPLHFSPKPSP